MRTIGVIFIAIGLIFLLYALTMDISVYAYGVGDVINLELMSQRQIFVIISIAAIVIGLGLVVIYSFKSEAVTQVGDQGEFKKCPQCAEFIRREAKICRFCNYKFTEEELRKAQEEEALTEVEENLDYTQMTIAEREEIMNQYGVTFNRWSNSYCYKDFKDKDLKNVLSYIKDKASKN